jgi:hypothetical protein
MGNAIQPSSVVGVPAIMSSTDGGRDAVAGLERIVEPIASLQFEARAAAVMAWGLTELIHKGHLINSYTNKC